MKHVAHMKITLCLLTLIVMNAMVSSCDKESAPTIEEKRTYAPNAEIIGFNSEKCGCCWGWVIRFGADTIKADSIPNVDKIGYGISKPIPVYIELGTKKADCSSMLWSNPINNKDYFAISRLELIE